MVAALGLVGRPVRALEYGVGQHPTKIEFESTDPIDDLVVTNEDGSRTYFQCKRTCGRNKHLRDALAQVVNHCTTHGYGDRLVIASSDFIGDVRALPSALRKRRTGGTLGADEKKAIRAIEDELQVFGGIEREQLLDVLHAWRIDATDVTKSEYEPVAAWVSTFLKTPTQVEAAIAILKTYLHHLASTASACTVTDVWWQLSNGGIEIVADASGTLAQKLAAKRHLLEIYKESVSASKDLIRLPINHDLLTLRVESLMPQIHGTVDASDDDRRSRSRPLMDITRRLKRYVLHGGPGAGKSTAIEQLAASTASEAEAPVPVVVRLRKLAKKVEHDTDVDLRMVLSCADHLANDDELTKIVTELACEGSLLLIFDGVDECRTATRHVLNGLKRLLEGPLRDNGIVVTTRPSVLDQVKHLGLPTVALDPPASPQSIPTALIGALAAQRPPEIRGEWRTAKIRLLERVLGKSEELARLPLLAMTIAILIAAEHTSESSSPASILEGAVRLGIEDWERERSSGTLVDYDNGLLTPQRLLDAFITIGHCLARGGPVSVEDAARSVAEMYVEVWRVSTRGSEEMARHAVKFWDERMSIFVTSESNLIEPRSRQFIEVADALWVTSASAESKRDWIADALADETMIETAMLAIGKDVELAAQLLSDSTNPQRALEWVTTYGVNDDLPEPTVQQCLSHLHTSAMSVARERDHRGVDWEQLERSAARQLRDGPRWQFILSAARLRCPPELRADRDTAVALCELTDETVVATALSSVTDAIVDGRELTQCEIDQLRSALELEIPPYPDPRIEGGRRHVFRIRSGEPLLRGRIELVVSAMNFVDQFTPEMAKLAENHANRASVGSGLHDHILKSLELAKFPVERQVALRPLPKHFSEAPDGRRWAAHEMEALGRVSSTPTRLSARDRWWATDVLDLVDIMDLASASGSRMEVQSDNAIGEDLTELAGLYCMAADINPANVGALIGHVHSTSGDAGLEDLMGLGFIRHPARQSDLDPRKIDLSAEHDQIIRTLCSEAEDIARSACKLMWDAHSEALSDELQEHVVSGRVPDPLWACAAAMQLSSDPSSVLDRILSANNDQLTYAAAILVNNADEASAWPAAKILRNSDDLTMRIAAGAQAESDDEAIFWLCTHCWHTNDLDHEDCAHCDTGTRPERKN